MRDEITVIAYYKPKEGCEFEKGDPFIKFTNDEVCGNFLIETNIPEFIHLKMDEEEADDWSGNDKSPQEKKFNKAMEYVEDFIKKSSERSMWKEYLDDGGWLDIPSKYIDFE